MSKIGPEPLQPIPTLIKIKAPTSKIEKPLGKKIAQMAHPNIEGPPNWMRKVISYLIKRILSLVK